MQTNNTTLSAIAGHTPEHMAQVAEQSSYKKASNSSVKTLSLALSAGVFIGLAFVFYITVTTGSDSLGWGVSRLMGGLAFSLGLVLLVVCGGELFTSSVLSIIPRANGKLNTQKMLANWAKVYVGNFIGALLLVAVVFGAKLHLLDHGLWGLNALSIAQHKLEHSFMQALLLGMLCNLLVCLAVWMTFSTVSSAAKAWLVILPVAMFVSTGFEHVVANMFMVPLGIAIKSWAGPEFWSQVGLPAAHFAHLNWHSFVVNNLIPVTLGNILGGGLIVGLGYWSIYHRGQLVSNNHSSNQSNFTYPLSNPVGDTTMKNIKQLTVADVMGSAADVLTTDMTIAVAADALIRTQQAGAVVVDSDMRVSGFVSELEVLRALWLEDYQAVAPTKVEDIMQKDVVTVALNDNLLKLAEYMSVDLTQVYPVSDSGMLLRSAHQTVEERLQASSVYRPKIYPVVENGRLVGVVTRHDVLTTLRPLLGEQTQQASGTSEHSANVLEVA